MCIVWNMVKKLSAWILMILHPSILKWFTTASIPLLWVTEFIIRAFCKYFFALAGEYLLGGDAEGSFSIKNCSGVFNCALKI